MTWRLDESVTCKDHDLVFMAVAAATTSLFWCFPRGKELSTIQDESIFPSTNTIASI